MKYRDEFLNTPVDALELSVRTTNVLTVHSVPKVECVGDLVQKTDIELLRTVNCGRKSLNEIKAVLASMGLHLGMKPIVYLDELKVPLHCWGP